MPLFIISIPLMVLAVAMAVIPLLVMSHREHLSHQEALAQLADRPNSGAATAADAAEVAGQNPQLAAAKR